MQIRPHIMDIILIAVMPLLFGGGSAWFVAKYGMRLNLADVANERSSHTGSIPKGGGVGILITLIFLLFYLNLSFFLWVPTIFLSVLSLVGDKTDLSIKLRLFAQMLCSIVVLIGSSQLNGIVSYLLFPILIVYIMGTANIYNFMDGINGIAGLTAVIAFFFMAYYATMIDAPQEYIFLCSAMALSCLGFLFFNIPVAFVFMGDVGSILIGFLIASIVILLARDFMDFICMAGFLFPFYLDEATTMLVRLKNKENLTRPHRKHLYQLLVNEIGIDHWKVSLVYGLVQILVCATIVKARMAGMGALLLSFAMYGFVFIFITVKIRRTVAAI